MAIEPEVGRNLKKSVVQSCVRTRGLYGPSFKRIARKIVQIFTTSLMEQGQTKNRKFFFSGCAGELKLQPFDLRSKTTSDCSNRFFSKKNTH